MTRFELLEGVARQQIRPFRIRQKCSAYADEVELVAIKHLAKRDQIL